jgi:ribosome-associated protein
MDYISKTQKKKEAHSLQELGKKLLQLSRVQIKEINIPEEVLDALNLARTVKSHEGLRRQMQFIGSLMRKIDSDSIQQAVDHIEQGNYKKALEFKETEQWRDELISGNNELLEEILENHVNADRQQLSQLVRNARKEVGNNKPPKSSRALFKYLREIRSK